MTWDDARAHLPVLAALEAGWNSYGARPVHPEALAHARALLDALEAAGAPPPEAVVPTVAGYVQIEWTAVEVDVAHDGYHWENLDHTLSRSGGTRWEWPPERQADCLSSLIAALGAESINAEVESV